MYPALAVLQALESENENKMPVQGDEREKDPSLRKQRSDLEIFWIGGLGGMEADLIRRQDIAYEGIPAAGVHGVGVKAMPGNLWQIGRGLLAARRILRRFQPNVIFFTGGYVAVPVALASRLPGLGFPAPANLLYVPDIEPGWALKTLSRFADHIAVTVTESRRYFRGDKGMTVVGYPARQDLKSWNKASARKALKLSVEPPILLVVGGSTGARSINMALLAILPELLREMQVVHASGMRDWKEVESAAKGLTDEQRSRYKAYPYLHAEMGAALAAADLVLSRAGASSLGEFPLFGLPSILVPYPYAWRYQQNNARYLSDRGAAVVIEDQSLPDRLLPVIQELIRNVAQRENMSQAMSELARPEAAESIGNLLYSLTKVRTQREV